MSLSRLLMALTLVVVVLAFAGFVPLALEQQPAFGLLPPNLGTYLILVIGLALSLYLGFQRIVRVFIQHAQVFHDLGVDEAEGLINRLLFGMRRPGGMVALRVQAGQVDLDGPSVVHKVGGPAFLSVDHDSVVVTSRLGYLHRVLGPGGHPLEPFERVWDVVDLRPQRRTIVVEFMTRDGIPASCQATIVSRIAGPQSVAQAVDAEGHHGAYFNYAEDAVLQVSTSGFVRRVDSGYRVSDWVTGMANGALDGAIRDALEQYTLDEFLNPQYWLRDDEGPSRAAAAPKLVPDLEEAIERKVKATGRERGVTVIRVEMGTVRPSEQAISRQWLEFWQAKLQQQVDLYAMKAEVTRAELAASAQVEVRVAFLNRVLERLQKLHAQDINIPGELVVSSITDVLETMYSRGSEVERAFYPPTERAESLVQAFKMIRQGSTRDALGDSGSGSNPPLPVDEG